MYEYDCSFLLGVADGDARSVTVRESLDGMQDAAVV